MNKGWAVTKIPREGFPTFQLNDSDTDNIFVNKIRFLNFPKINFRNKTKQKPLD